MEDSFDPDSLDQHAFAAFDKISTQVVVLQRKCFKEKQICDNLAQRVANIGSEINKANCDIAAICAKQEEVIKKEKTLQSNLDSLEQSKQMLQQLCVDLSKQLKLETIKTNERSSHQDGVIRKYSAMWVNYEEIYNRFPLVEERNQLDIENRRAEIELMQLQADVKDVNDRISTQREINDTLTKRMIVKLAEQHRIATRQATEKEELQAEIESVKRSIAASKKIKEELLKAPLIISAGVAPIMSSQPTRPDEPRYGSLPPVLPTLQLPSFASPPRKVRCYEDIRRQTQLFTLSDQDVTRAWQASMFRPIAQSPKPQVLYSPLPGLQEALINPLQDSAEADNDIDLSQASERNVVDIDEDPPEITASLHNQEDTDVSMAELENVTQNSREPLLNRSQEVSGDKSGFTLSQDLRDRINKIPTSLNKSQDLMPPSIEPNLPEDIHDDPVAAEPMSVPCTPMSIPCTPVSVPCTPVSVRPSAEAPVTPKSQSTPVVCSTTPKRAGEESEATSPFTSQESNQFNAAEHLAYMAKLKQSPKMTYAPRQMIRSQAGRSSVAESSGQSPYFLSSLSDIRSKMDQSESMPVRQDHSGGGDQGASSLTPVQEEHTASEQGQTDFYARSQGSVRSQELPQSEGYSEGMRRDATSQESSVFYSIPDNVDEANNHQEYVFHSPVVTPPGSPTRYAPYVFHSPVVSPEMSPPGFANPFGFSNQAAPTNTGFSFNFGAPRSQEDTPPTEPGQSDQRKPPEKFNFNFGGTSKPPSIFKLF